MTIEKQQSAPASAADDDNEREVAPVPASAAGGDGGDDGGDEREGAFVIVDGRIKQRIGADAKQRPAQNTAAIRDDAPFESVGGRIKQVQP
jgi:hypothetical protein